MIVAKQREKAGTTDTKGKLVVTRSKHAITIFQVSSDTSGPAPIQIVLSEQKVWTTQRGLRALQFGANLADSAHDGPGYTRRLEKYEQRGWKIAVPGFEPNKLSSNITRDHIYLEAYDVLLRPETSVGDPKKDICLPLKAFDGNRMMTIEQKVSATALQTCRSLQGFEPVSYTHLRAHETDS